MAFYQPPYVLHDQSGNPYHGLYNEPDESKRTLEFRYEADPSGENITIITIECLSWVHTPHQASQAVLSFKPGQRLGVVTFRDDDPMTTRQFLPRFVSGGSSTDRVFTGPDGQRYRLQYEAELGEIWTCTTEEGTLVAHYDRPFPGEVIPVGYTGCTLTIMSEYVDIALEIFVAGLICRRFAAYSNWVQVEHPDIPK